MVEYTIHCPVHKKRLLRAREQDCVTVTSMAKGKETRPIFYCAYCDCYYIPTDLQDKNNAKMVQKYKGKDIFCTTEKYGVNSFWKKGMRENTGKSAHKKEDNDRNVSDTYVRGLADVEIKNPVRIHIFRGEEVTGKLLANFTSIRNTYPTVINGKMDVNWLISKVFPAGLLQDVIVRNDSFKGNNDNLNKSVFICNLTSSYLKRILPANTYLAFRGKLVKGELVINEIRIWENPVFSEDDKRVECTFLYDGPTQVNILYDYTKEVAKKSSRLEGELQDWNSYLDWKRNLAELRIKGVKYIGLKLDIDAREMSFLLVTEGKAEFEEFRKYIRRNEVSVFSNNYSKQRWYFEFNREYQDSSSADSGILLSFVRFEKAYGINEVDPSEWDSVRDLQKQYGNREEIVDTRQVLREIGHNYFAPQFFEVVFELSPNAISIVDRQIRVFGETQPNIEELIAGEFYNDGYIATSQIGDFALLKRLKNAVNNLANGQCASQGLAEWLFNIKKARIPESIDTITAWQNPLMNASQKEAVEKILAVPDVCLIQGPPGTGKTTVIAEAIYQLVIRNKRVLVASQANLAVDNALERLISNPKIRAIRLGNARKIDASVGNITEENVLESFYESILSYISKEYIEKWEKADAIRKELKKDYDSYTDVIDDIENCKKELRIQQNHWNNIQMTFDPDEEYSRRNKNKEQKIILKTVRSFCKGSEDDLDIMLSKDNIMELWSVMNSELTTAKNNGLNLTPRFIDVDDLNSPERLSFANDVISLVLSNCRLADSLAEKMSKLDSYRGESKELEELKIREQKLEKNVLSDPSMENLQRWKEVKLRIAELSEAGDGLSEAESRLFDLESIKSLQTQEQKEHILKILRVSLPQTALIIKNVEAKANELIENISAEEGAFEERFERIQINKEKINEEIQRLEESISSDRKKIEEIEGKYNAAPGELKSRMSEIEGAADDLESGEVERRTWEEVFQGMKNWVNNIPDYMQENDLYLKDYINGCNVVGISCTESARTLIENGFDDFDVVIIDEVSKATPPELLIPMLRGRKIVLVGDHRQLPPLFNEHEKTYLEVAEQQDNSSDEVIPLTMADFNKYKDMVTSSLFERYFEQADKSIKETLTDQYRMHRDIMDVINTFYDDYLRDGNEGHYTEETKAHHLNIRSLIGTEMIVPERHAYWFDSSELLRERIYEQRRAESTSAENIVEAEIIIELLRKMELQYANMMNKRQVSVGIISFYYDQVMLIRKLLRGESFHAINVEVNTVDRFQGKEKEIVFVSLVRNVKRSRHNIDSHIAAFQRINVAFSRAQNLLIIVGAKDMYAEQPVRITDMNNGEEKIIMAYKRIIEMMDKKGTFFTSDEILPAIKAAGILDKLAEAKGGVDE